jgi:CheY-like chemotaxis protein
MASVLVIDDDAALRRTLRRVLERAGHQVLEAPEGRTGLKVYLERKPDLVITDIIMPEQEGIETIMELRRVAPTVPIIAISGSGPVGKVDFLHMAEQIGANVVLRKPIRAEDLTAAVARVLR